MDSNTLIYSAIESMQQHKRVRSFFERRVLTGELVCAVTFPVLLEFIHVTTDARRFACPLSLEESVAMAERYWTAGNWRQLLPQSGTGARTIDLLNRHRLGRKRLLDSYFAATLLDNGIKALITCDAKDFGVFRELRLINPLRE